MKTKEQLSQESLLKACKKFTKEVLNGAIVSEDDFCVCIDPKPMSRDMNNITTCVKCRKTIKEK